MVKRVVPPGALLILVVGAWEAWVRIAGIDRAVFASPSAVARALAAQADALVPHAATTLGETAIGLVLGALIGLIVATILASFELARSAAEPLLVALQTVPAVVLAPILVLAFGFGWAPRIIVVIGVVFFPVAIATTGAFRAVDPDRVELVRALGGSRWDVLRHVTLPGSLPAMFDGLRISAAYALGSAAVAEQIGGAQSGLGLFITRSQRNFRSDQVLAGVVVIALLSVMVYGLVSWAARRATPWMTTSTVEDPR